MGAVLVIAPLKEKGREKRRGGVDGLGILKPAYPHLLVVI